MTVARWVLSRELPAGGGPAPAAAAGAGVADRLVQGRVRPTIQVETPQSVEPAARRNHAIAACREKRGRWHGHDPRRRSRGPCVARDTGRRAGGDRGARYHRQRIVLGAHGRAARRRGDTGGSGPARQGGKPRRAWSVRHRPARPRPRSSPGSPGRFRGTDGRSFHGWVRGDRGCGAPPEPYDRRGPRRRRAGVPGTGRLDPDAALQALLGPALARLEMTFPSRDSYREFWQAHPAFKGEWTPWIEDYVQHDLVGTGPFRSSCVADAVRVDGAQLLTDPIVQVAIHALPVPGVLVYAERGLLDESPALYDRARVAGLHVRTQLVPGTNHYSILLADPGAAVVADHIRRLLHREGGRRT